MSAWAARSCSSSGSDRTSSTVSSSNFVMIKSIPNVADLCQARLRPGSQATRIMHGSVNPCGHALIDALDQPRKCIGAALEDDVVLQNVVEVDMQAAMAIENG